MKFCKDCKHLEPSHLPGYERCRKSFDADNAEYLVSGIEKQAMFYCSTARTLGGNCGPLGLLFEPKVERDAEAAEASLRG